MMRRHIHYEAAFESYIRARQWPYLPVDEQKRVIFTGARIKSFDFLVYRPNETAWLVDIKGRRFPYDTQGGKRYWENWVTLEDIDGLRAWQGVFGEDFVAGFVFAYWLTGPSEQWPTQQVHEHREQSYAFLWVSAETYAEHARKRSDSWGTVSMPTQAFKDHTKLLDEV